MMVSYLVTVIIPVYNLECVLDRALESLFVQTFPFEKMEIILVDDSSDDKSTDIEKNWSEKYSNVKVISSGGNGVSAARNTGIKEAAGKYILFLDGDDLLSGETVENLVRCFEDWGDNVDLVTYPLRSYLDGPDGQLLPDHFRYKYLTKTGIYDLNRYPYITQTTMNVMVKNRFSDNIRFRENMSFTEDQAYCFEVLKKKFRMGFCADAEYKYIRTKISSSYVQMGSKYIFESCMSFWEKLFEEYSLEGDIPGYIQAAYINDIAWKTRSDVFYPYEKRDDRDFLRSKERIIKLMNKVSDEIIRDHCGLDKFQKAYIFSLKSNNSPLVLSVRNRLMTVLEKGPVFNESYIELRVKRIYIKDDILIIRGYFASPSFSFTEKPLFYRTASINEGKEEYGLDVVTAAESWHKSHTKTNDFWAFEDRIKISGGTSHISYSAKIGYSRIKTRIIWSDKTPFHERPYEKRLCTDKISVSFTGSGEIKTEPCDKYKRNRYLKKEKLHYEKCIPDLAYIRGKAQKISDDDTDRKGIWLYYDCRGAVDNGFIQFLHDLKKNDGIERYYVTFRSSLKLIEKYNIDRKKLLLFGEHRHQILFLCCDKIITAFIEDYNLIPYSKEDHGRVADMIRHEYIYIQHGVIHAYVPWKYTWLGNEAEKVVISSEYEHRLLKETYNYPESSIIISNMPRFRKSIKKESGKRKKYILYAPSWRNWLVHMDDNGIWQSSPKRFEVSDFKKALDDIFNSEKLQKELEKLDITMYVQLHPIMECYTKYIKSCENGRIKAAEPGLAYKDCSVFITDYSSYVFDFVNRKTPVIYYFADEDDFYGGLNGYYRLSLPLEEGFGKICRNAEELCSEIEVVAKNEWQPESRFLKRMEGFFYSLEKPQDIIYEGIKKSL